MNEGEKENRRGGGGIEIGHWTRLWKREEQEKKNEERKNNIKNKKF